MNRATPTTPDVPAIISRISGCSLSQAEEVADLYLEERILIEDPAGGVRVIDQSFMTPHALCFAIAIVEGRR